MPHQGNQRRTTSPAYLVEEPNTGLYALIDDGQARLAKKCEASRFDSRREAALAVAGSSLAGQPHELVRVDR